MKRLKYLCFLILILIGKQTKAQVQLLNVDSVKNYLTGNWDWYKSCGGLAGLCYTPASPGYTTAALKFTKIPAVADSIAYTVYQSGNPTAVGHTKITYNPGNLWYLEAIQFSAVSSIKYKLALFITKPDTVWLREECNDCFTRQYRRNSNPNTGLLQTNNNSGVFACFPNPVKDQLQIQLWPLTEIKTICLYNHLGQNCALSQITENTIQLSELNQGIYWLIIQTNKGTFSQKIIKE